MSQFNVEAFQELMRDTADRLCNAASYAITGSGFTSRSAAKTMADLANNNMTVAHGKLMAALALVDGAPCAATAVEVRGGEEIPLEVPLGGRTAAELDDDIPF